MTKIKFKLKNSKDFGEFMAKIVGNFDDKKFAPNHFLDEFGSHQATLDEYYDFVKNNTTVKVDGKNKDYSQKDEQECQEDRKFLKGVLAAGIYSDDKGDIKKQISDFLATGAGKNWSETAKKVFLENLNEITSEIFAALKTLVPLLETAHGNSADNLADLEKYSSAEATTRGLEKMTNKVVAARTAAKTLLDEVDKDNAYNAIGIANIKKISEINAIKDLFSQAKQGYAMTSRDINLYKKDDKKADYSDGYVAGAWKKLEEFKQKAVADFDKVKAATTENELEEMLQGVIAAATDTATKESEYQDDEAGLKKIEEDINKLREYKEAKSDEEKGQVFAKIKSVTGIDYAITEFIKQMESKKDLIKAALKKKEEEEHNKKNDPSTTNGTP
ncbi:13446_t:CDS:2 [Entrophospora sp. SA101]|nr:13446_t:CDS:2 [Entrophospora sp. SA101]